MNTKQYFETIKCQNKTPLNLQYHNQRIKNTINKELNLSKYIKPSSNQLTKCKVVYDHNNILDISYDIYQKKLIKNIYFVFDDDIVYDTKQTNRDQINNLYNQKPKEAHEIIIVKNNLITDTSIANIAIYDGKDWLSAIKPLLFGTTRQRYIDQGKLKLSNITIDDLKNAKKIAFLNAMIDFDIQDQLCFMN